MKCKLITTTSSLKNCYHLKRSLDYFGWDYHFIEHTWKGFGDKILETYKYLKANPDITHFFYSDAWDTMAFGTMEEALKQIPDKDVILFSAERACYPHPDKAEKYPYNMSPWHFLNGGGWFASSELFCKMVDRYPLDSVTVDQVYFTDRFLDQDSEIELDYDCKVFQTIAFCPESDFDITNKPFNTVTKSFPVFWHGNGHTPMDKLTPLIPPTLQSTIEIWEHPDHENEDFRSMLINLPHIAGDKWIVVEQVKHVIGTCVMHNSKLLDEIGGLYQPGLYGYDDVLYSWRSHFAGYKNVFIPYIEIDHIDTGATPFQDWKHAHSGKYTADMITLVHEYAGGKSLYYEM